METILICAVAVLVIAVIILARCVWNVNQNSKFSINGLAKKIEERNLWAVALEKELGIELRAMHRLDNGVVYEVSGSRLNNKVSALERNIEDERRWRKAWQEAAEKALDLKPGLPFIPLNPSEPIECCFFSRGRDKELNLLLDHLKLEIINEPEKTVVRRKK